MGTRFFIPSCRGSDFGATEMFLGACGLSGGSYVAEGIPQQLAMTAAVDAVYTDAATWLAENPGWPAIVGSRPAGSWVPDRAMVGRRLDEHRAEVRMTAHSAARHLERFAALPGF